jgi:hypothetical protein
VTLLTLYESQTPGVEAYDNTSVVLAGDNEPQPDASLLLVPTHDPLRGWDKDDCIVGTPEWLGEVSDRSRRIDLKVKKVVYQKAGGLEYLVVDVHKRTLHWFDLQGDKLLKPDSDGVVRSRIFPGLWIDPDAFFARSPRGAIAVLQRGLASPEHTRFVKRLQRRRKK